jgi:hypothetical protein
MPRLVNNRRLLILIMLALGGAGLAFWLAPSREPSYQGRRLSAWLYDLGMKQDDTNAIAAIWAIGTNAVPHLVRAVSYKPGRVRDLWFSPAEVLLRLLKRPFYDPSKLRCAGALQGFAALGPASSNAVPPLAALLGDPHMGILAAGSLSMIGPIALSSLTPALTNSSSRVRFNALVAVGRLGTNGRPAQVAVLCCLPDTNVVDGASVRTMAAFVLGEMHFEAEKVVPALTNVLNDADYAVRALAVQSLGKFGTEARPAVPALTRALADPDPTVSQAAALALRAIDPEGAVRREGSHETDKSDGEKR